MVAARDWLKSRGTLKGGRHPFLIVGFVRRQRVFQQALVFFGSGRSGLLIEAVMRHRDLGEKSQKRQHQPFFLRCEGKNKFILLAAVQSHDVRSMVAWRLYFCSW